MEALSHLLQGIVDRLQMCTDTLEQIRTAKAWSPDLYKITDHFHHLLSDSGQFSFSNVSKVRHADSHITWKSL